MNKENFRVVVGAVIYNHDKKFLLARRHIKDDNLPNFWSIPAGHVEAFSNDSDVLELNLKREVKEEIGVDIQIVKYLDSHVWCDTEYKKITVIFLCKIKSGIEKALDETSEVAWFNIERINGMKLPPNVNRVISKAWKIIE